MELWQTVLTWITTPFDIFNYFWSLTDNQFWKDFDWVMVLIATFQSTFLTVLGHRRRSDIPFSKNFQIFRIFAQSIFTVILFATLISFEFISKIRVSTIMLHSGAVFLMAADIASRMTISFPHKARQAGDVPKLNP